MGAETSPETALQERSAVYFATALGCGMAAIPLIGGLTLTIYAAVAAIPVMITVILILCFGKDDV